jgi:hypothetical protein
MLWKSMKKRRNASKLGKVTKKEISSSIVCALAHKMCKEELLE